MSQGEKIVERPGRPASVFLTFALVVAVLVAMCLAGALCLMLAVGIELIPHD